MGHRGSEYGRSHTAYQRRTGPHFGTHHAHLSGKSRQTDRGRSERKGYETVMGKINCPTDISLNSLCKANYVWFHILAVNKQTKSDYFEITMQKYGLSASCARNIIRNNLLYALCRMSFMIVKPFFTLLLFYRIMFCLKCQNAHLPKIYPP